MKKLIFICLLASLTSLHGYAQYSMDFGVSLGASNYLGEIGGNTGEAKPFIMDMKLKQTSFGIGGFYRYNFTRSVAAKLTINYARISGADSLSNEPTRIARNLSFRTDLLEFSLLGEFTFFSFNDMSRRSKSRVDFSTYVTAGVGILMYYPYAQHDGKWYYLRPLATEGIENVYDETAIVIPFGLGANFTFNRKMRLGFEMVYRFTNTDYLDDVSTDYAYDSELPFEESAIFANRSAEAYARGNADLPNQDFYRPGARRGNPDRNDGYLFAQVSLSYYISKGNSFGRSRYKSVISRRKKRTKF
ncbi:MAG: outer membrane beta-barrel protein [Flavobacteriales bacterium]|nr:outer membrane beta-barrel protein [Flavobacteriales bacterium]